LSPGTIGFVAGDELKHGQVLPEAADADGVLLSAKLKATYEDKSQAD